MLLTNCANSSITLALFAIVLPIIIGEKKEVLYWQVHLS